MEKEFIPYELALELNELLFNEPCFGYWSNWAVQEPFLLTCELGKEIESASINRKNILFKAPTFSQAFRFFREKYDLHPSIESYNQDENGNDIEYTYTYCVVTNKNLPKEWNKFYNTYEEAELECLKKLIEIVKNK